MLFTIPNAIIQNPKKRKIIGPGKAIKVKPLVDITPAIAIRVPVTINKIDTKMDLSFVETKNAAVASATAPKPKIIPLTIVLSPNNWAPAAFVATSAPEIRNRMSAAMANAFASLVVKELLALSSVPHHHVNNIYDRSFGKLTSSSDNELHLLLNSSQQKI